MHGVLTDLDLTPFHGATLLQIAVGPYDLQLRFDSSLSISIEGRWELCEPQGARSDSLDRLRTVAGRTVISTQVHAPTSIALVFDGGAELVIYDDSRDYESFSISPGGIFV